MKTLLFIACLFASPVFSQGVDTVTVFGGKIVIGKGTISIVGGTVVFKGDTIRTVNDSTYCVSSASVPVVASAKNITYAYKQQTFASTGTVQLKEGSILIWTYRIGAVGLAITYLEPQ